MKVNLAILALHNAPAIVVKPWKEQHGLGEGRSLPEAINWFLHENRIDSAEWVFLETTPLDSLVSWIATTLEAWKSDAPESHKDMCFAVADAISDWLWLPPKFWAEWEQRPGEEKKRLLEAFWVAGHVLPLESDERRARAQIRTAYAAILAAVHESMGGSSLAARIHLLELAIPSLEEIL